MNLSETVFTKAPLTWPDVHKQLLSAIQTRSGQVMSASQLNAVVGAGQQTSAASAASGAAMAAIISSSNASIAVNRLLVKQCTDLLIKHIKNLNQAQVIDQLENLAQSNGLRVYKTPSEEEPTTVNAFLNTDDFYFDISVKITGEISDVKFAFFSDSPASSPLLKEIFTTWNWDLLGKHIAGIRANFILNDPDLHVKGRAFKALQTLEKDLNTLYHVQLKYLEKHAVKNNGTKPANNNLSATVTSQSKTAYLTQSKNIEKLVNYSPIGVLKRSQLGQPLRLIYYLSPMDLIQHHTRSQFSSTYKVLVNHSEPHEETKSTTSSSSSFDVEGLLEHELGSSCTISLQSTRLVSRIRPVVENDSGEVVMEDATVATETEEPGYLLAETSTLVISESDERAWHDHLAPYLNFNFDFERVPLFQPTAKSTAKLPGCFLLKLSKPVVMCVSTLSELQQRIGIETVSLEPALTKLTPFFELLAKTEINSKILSDAYSVQLPDENQVYYITELDQPNCQALVVDHIQFASGQDLVHILDTLRKQLLFNELLLSCMRKLCTNALSSSSSYSSSSSNSNDTPQVRIIELGLSAPLTLSLIMQHPRLLCYTTIEIDVSRHSIETRFKDHNDLHNPLVISEIVRRCHSIPVTLRALFAKYRQSNGAAGLNCSTSSSSTTSSIKKRPPNNGGGGGGASGGSSGGLSFNGGGSNGDSDNNGGGNAGGSNHGKECDDQHTRDYDGMMEQDLNMIKDDGELHVTPPSLINRDHNGPVYTTLPNRLTPSRRDSYNRMNSGGSHSATPTSLTSIFNFDSSVVQKQTVKSEPKDDSKLESTGKLANKLEASKSDQSIGSEKTPQSKLERALSTNNGSGKTPKLEPSTATSKKRKASSSSESSSSSNPAQVAQQQAQQQQPVAKQRKMSQQGEKLPSSDLKRHNSMLEDSALIDGAVSKLNKSTDGKKVSSDKNSSSAAIKLKSSLSSIDLASSSPAIAPKPSSSENTIKKTSNSEKSQVKKDSILTAAPLNSNNQSTRRDKEGKLINQKSSTPSSISSSSSSSPNTSTSSKKLLSSSSKPSSTPNSTNSMRIKPITEDGLKIRISKDSQQQQQMLMMLMNTSGKKLPSSATSTPSGANKSSIELQMKARSTSPHVHLTPLDISSSKAINNTSARTPSPLQQASLSSISTASPSPLGVLSEDLTSIESIKSSSKTKLTEYQEFEDKSTQKGIYLADNDLSVFVGLFKL